MLNGNFINLMKIPYSEPRALLATVRALEPLFFTNFLTNQNEYLTHCSLSDWTLKKLSLFSFFVPVLLGIHRNPRQKEFFNSCEIIQFIHLDISTWTEPWDIFRIKFRNGILLALQIKAFGPKIGKFFLFSVPINP